MYPQTVTLLAACPLPDHTAGQPANACTLPASGPEPNRQPYHRAKPRSGAPGFRQLPDLITTNRTPRFLVLTCCPGRYPLTMYPQTVTLLAAMPAAGSHRGATGQRLHPTGLRPPALNFTTSHTAGPSPAPGLPAAASCQTPPPPTRTLLFLVMTCRPCRITPPENRPTAAPAGFRP